MRNLNGKEEEMEEERKEIKVVKKMDAMFLLDQLQLGLIKRLSTKIMHEPKPNCKNRLK